MGNSNFLPKFEVTENLSNGLKQIKKAEAMSAGWYKGKLHYHLKKAGALKSLNGEYYYTGIEIDGDSRNFFKKGTRGYHIAEFLRLLGFEDADLNELIDTWRNDSVEGLSIRWRSKGDISPSKFKRYLEEMRTDLQDVDTIEIDYELQRYKISDYPTYESRVYNSRESIYGDGSRWGQRQTDYNANAWSSDGRIFGLQSIQTKGTESSIGRQIRFKKAGIDVTSTIRQELRYAVQSMIAYSGSSFMDLLSYSKTGEETYEVVRYSGVRLSIPITETYKSAIGTQVYSARIKNSFINDDDNKNFFKYTGMPVRRSTGKGSSPLWASVSIIQDNKTLTGRVPLQNGQELNQIVNVTGFFMTTAFWKYANYTSTEVSAFGIQINRNVASGDEFLFYDTKKESGAWIRVSEFKKLTLDEIGEYIGSYFDLVVDEKEGGFFSGFIGAVAGFLGTIFNAIFRVIEVIPVLRIQLQVITWAINKLFGTQLSEKEVFEIGVQIAWTIISVVAAPVTMGASIAIGVAIGLAVAGAKAEDAKSEAEKEQERKKNEQEARKKDKEDRAEEEEMKKKNRGDDSDQKSRDEFESFLKDPLFKETRERRKMKPDLKAQFRLL